MITQWIEQINASTPLLPHGICLSESPTIILGLIGAHAAIAASYFGIPYVMRQIESGARARGVDMAAFHVSALYRMFIILCGVTHLGGIMTLYIAAYEVYLAILIATAVVSVWTLVSIYRLIDPVIGFLADLKGLRV